MADITNTDRLILQQAYLADYVIVGRSIYQPDDPAADTSGKCRVWNSSCICRPAAVRVEDIIQQMKHEGFIRQKGNVLHIS